MYIPDKSSIRNFKKNGFSLFSEPPTNMSAEHSEPAESSEPTEPAEPAIIEANGTVEHDVQSTNVKGCNYYQRSQEFLRQIQDQTTSKKIENCQPSVRTNALPRRLQVWNKGYKLGKMVGSTKQKMKEHSLFLQQNPNVKQYWNHPINWFTKEKFSFPGTYCIIRSSDVSCDICTDFEIFRYVIDHFCLKYK